jgi:histidyl-tRNA synthetase
MRGAPLLLDRLDADDAEHFAAVRDLLDAASVPYEVDPTLVRGMDYYTRTVFEFTSDKLGAQSAIGGGGRYDGLVEMLGGPATPGCGFAAGIERMMLASPGLPAAAPPVDLYVAFEGDGQRAMAFAIAAEARDARLNAQMELAGRSRKGQLKQADRLGARYVAIVNDTGTVLKDMQSGEQIDVEPGGLVARILRNRGMR